MRSHHRTENKQRNGDVTDMLNRNMPSHIGIYMYNDHHTRWRLVDQSGILVTSDLHEITKPLSAKVREGGSNTVLVKGTHNTLFGKGCSDTFG